MRKFGFVVLLFSLFLISCDDKKTEYENCGDGVLDIGEDCEGLQFGGNTCLGLGYHDGIQTCNDNCTVNTTNCISFGKCGDGNIDDAYGEECDGENLPDVTCESLEFYGGTLSCNNDCKFDLTGCESVGSCGDGIIQGEFNEECDGENLNGSTCILKGYYGGLLECVDCSFVIDPCIDAGKCGDEDIQYEFDEDCEGTESSYACDWIGVGDSTLIAGCTDCKTDFSTCSGIFFKKISTGASHSCGFAEGSSLIYCWGDNQYGQLGDGTTTDSSTPVKVNLPTNMETEVIAITAGGGHSCALTEGSRVFCWGNNFYGQLGNGTDINSPTPIEITDPSISGKILEISAGGNHTCATDYSSAHCWGRNTHGQLGINSDISTKVPVEVSTDYSFSSITCGESHTCAISVDSANAYCWGSDLDGRLGYIYGLDMQIPTPLPTDITFDKIYAGFNHTCGLSTEDENNILCWGANEFGQLGDGTTDSSHIPHAPSISPSYTSSSISAGYNHTCAIINSSDSTISSSLYCWGSGSSGEIGNNNNSAVNSTPLIVDAGEGIEYVEASAGGNGTTCGLKIDSASILRGFCWGDNTQGQLGTGTTTNSSIPMAVVDPF
jgi:alpha-tubulin suppressor-like RCC1 family protein